MLLNSKWVAAGVSGTIMALFALHGSTEGALGVMTVWLTLHLADIEREVSGDA